jgi:hypothetical protein
MTSARAIVPPNRRPQPNHDIDLRNKRVNKLAAAIEAASDAALLACLGNNANKLRIVRGAAEAMKARRQDQTLLPLSLALEAYVP